MKSIIHPRTGVLTLIIIVAATWRFFISGQYTPYNFTPVGAIALFGGCYYASRWKAFLLPLLALWIGDIFLNYFVYYNKLVLFYEGFIWTYASFAMIVLMGSFIKKVNPKSILITAIGAALIHFLLANFGVWAFGMDFTTGKPFANNIQGLLKCYTLALPFVKSMLTGNLIFGAIMFGAFEWANRKFPILQSKPVLNAA